MLKAEIAKARGKALLVEATATAWEQGRAAAPQRDWIQSRLGLQLPAELVELSKDTFARVLAACGCSPALFDDSDGTSKHEAIKQFYLGTVQPLAQLLKAELTAKLEMDTKLNFDLHSIDSQGCAQAFQKLVAGDVTVNDALVTSRLLANE